MFDSLVRCFSRRSLILVSALSASMAVIGCGGDESGDGPGNPDGSPGQIDSGATPTDGNAPDIDGGSTVDPDGSNPTTDGGMTPDGGGTGFRPYSGPTANLRLINGDLLTDTAGRKVCLFGTDGDPRPYAVFNRLGFAGGDVITVDATYVKVPAGVDLRASHSITVGIGSDTAEGCVADDAQPLAPSSLTQDGYYTLVVRTYDEFFTRECAANASEDYCEFYGRSHMSETEVPCADQGLFLFADGFQISGDYVEAIRIVNLTSNASQIGSSFQSSSYSTNGNVAGGSAVGSGYDVTPDTDRMRICPTYLACDPAIADLDEAEAMLACTSDGDAAWTLAEVTDARLSADNRDTTVYVFGNAGILNASGTGVQNADIGIAIAHDVTDGPLP